jgi:hypothetical protein
MKPTYFIVAETKEGRVFFNNPHQVVRGELNAQEWDHAVAFRAALLAVDNFPQYSWQIVPTAAPLPPTLLSCSFSLLVLLVWIVVVAFLLSLIL